MNNDIFDSKQININVEKQILIIDNCKNIKIQFNVTNTNSSIKRVVCVNEIIEIVTSMSEDLDWNLILSERVHMKINAL